MPGATMRRAITNDTSVYGEGDDMTEKMFISVAEAADLLGLSKWQVYELANKGTLPKHYIGSVRYRLRVADVRAYAESRPTEAPQDA